MITRTVSWGDDLWIKAARERGGLKAVHERIVSVLGRQVGVRNTFAKLFDCEDPSDLNDADSWRAWLLLTALGHDPEAWGIDTKRAVPSYINLDELVRRLTEVRQSRLGESNPRPIHYCAPTKPRIGSLVHPPVAAA